MQTSIYINSKNKPTLLVLPFKNESYRLHDLISKIEKLNLVDQVDVLLVDGGSTDDSINVSFFLKHKIHTLIEIKDSKGLSEQLRAAFRWASENNYDKVITIDSNGKDDPAYVFKILEKLNQGFEFVQASRYMVGGKGVNTPLLRHFAIKYIHVPLLRVASGFAWTDTTQGYRGYSSRIFQDQKVGIFRDIFQSYELLFYLSYRLPRLGYRCAEVPVVRTYPDGIVPTKIKGVLIHVRLFLALMKTCLGFYNPNER